MVLADILRGAYRITEKAARPALLGLALAYCGPTVDDDREGCRDDNDCRDGRVCEYDPESGGRACNGTTILLTTQDLGEINGAVAFRLGGLDLSVSELRSGTIPVHCYVGSSGSNCIGNCYNPSDSSRKRVLCGCDGYWVANSRATTFEVLFEYNGSDSEMNACRRLPTCHHEGVTQTDQDGNFSITNLLAGTYNFTLRPDRVHVDFVRGRDDGQCTRGGSENLSHSDFRENDTVTPPVKGSVGSTITIYTTRDLAGLQRGPCTFHCIRVGEFQVGR